MFFFGGYGHQDNDHSKEEKHEDEAHKDGKKEKHEEHSHDTHDDEDSSHSDVDAVWAFHCEKPETIETVTIKLFSAFPNGFEDIDVEWITSAGAGKTELEQDGVVSLKLQIVLELPVASRATGSFSQNALARPSINHV